MPGQLVAVARPGEQISSRKRRRQAGEALSEGWLRPSRSAARPRPTLISPLGRRDLPQQFLRGRLAWQGLLAEAQPGQEQADVVAVDQRARRDELPGGGRGNGGGPRGHEPGRRSGRGTPSGCGRA
jgi:hypothetical protein